MGKQVNAALKLLLPTAYMYDEQMTNLKQFCSVRLLVVVHLSLYRALKLTLPGDIGDRSFESTIKLRWTKDNWERSSVSLPRLCSVQEVTCNQTDNGTLFSVNGRECRNVAERGSFEAMEMATEFVCGVPERSFLKDNGQKFVHPILFYRFSVLPLPSYILRKLLGVFYPLLCGVKSSLVHREICFLYQSEGRLCMTIRWHTLCMLCQDRMCVHPDGDDEFCK